MNGDTVSEISRIAEELRKLDPTMKEALKRVVEGLEPFSLDAAMAMLSQDMRIVDMGTGYFRAESAYREGMLMRAVAVTVWQDGTLEGVRETVLNGAERRAVVHGVELSIQGTSTDRTIFACKVHTVQQAVDVVKVMRKDDRDKRAVPATTG